MMLFALVPVEVDHEKLGQMVKKRIELAFDQCLIQLNVFLYFKELIQLINGRLVPSARCKCLIPDFDDTIRKGEQNGNKGVFGAVDNGNSVSGGENMDFEQSNRFGS
jgi:hypothetical protein